VAVSTDVTSSTQVEGAVAEAVNRFGRLDAMIHNATSRRSSEVGTIDAMSDEVWADHVAVSLDGAYNCARAALPALKEHQGRLVVMTSPAAMEGSPKLPAYAAVKGALRGFVKSLAIEWGPLGVTVVAVSPLAMSPALENAYRENPELEARLRQLVPIGRVGEPGDDIAPVIAFLAGDGSRYITGQTIVVDGGRFTTL
jgi:3-oxoacyl-[acyl-carrier protein] reductase